MNLQALSQHLHSSPLGQRWQGLPPRDRLALLLLGGFLLLVLLYLLAWKPAQQHARDARDYYQHERELHAYLSANAERARGLQGGQQPQVQSVDAASLQGLLTRSAAEHGLSIERLDNQGEDGVQINLQGVAFAELLRWLVELEGRGVRIEESGLDRVGDGRVDARLNLRVEG